MSSIKCGNCKQHHQSVSEVKSCCASAIKAPVTQVPVQATLPVPETPKKQRVQKAGMFTHDGHIYKVQVAVHGSGNLYAKVLVPIEGEKKGRFEYAKGMVQVLDEAERMSKEQAKEFGALYGMCCQCGATLTDELSIEAGIGPVCAGKDVWA